MRLWWMLGVCGVVLAGCAGTPERGRADGYHPTTGKWSLASREKEQSLLQQGPLSELKGSVVPDIVIHTDDPGRALAVYDFKFPCVSLGDAPPWRRYPPGHSHAGKWQDGVYQEALNLREGIFRVVPRLGVLP